MQYRKMQDGTQISILGYGCMRFSSSGGRIDIDKAEKEVLLAIENGVNYFDTAYIYNGSEEALGTILARSQCRDKVNIATKLPYYLLKNTSSVEKLFQEQLRRLRTDHVDFYLMHAVNKERWDKMRDMGCIQVLEKLKKEGKIRYLGFSFHDSYEVFEEVLSYRDWDFCQIQFNYMDTQEQAGLKGYELAAEKQVPLIIMEPIKGGRLAAFSGDITEKFRKLDENASPASFALRWVGSFPNVKVILSGMSSMEQVQDNLKTFREFKPLSQEEQEVIRDVVKTMRGRVQNGCTGCKYCMPCPAGVDIPGCFGVWNNYHIYQNYNLVKQDWEKNIGESHQAKNCVKCGKCEAACPQKLSIREDLERAQADLDKREMAF